MDGAVIDLARLRQVIAVAEAGTFGRAAASIAMSQSALSRSVQATERHYGLTIFERGRHGARLTREGERFLEYAQVLVRHAEAVDDSLQQLRAGVTAGTAFGMGAASAYTFLGSVLVQLRNELPEVRLRVRVGANADLRGLLRSGEIEFYVGGVPSPLGADVAPARLIVEPIGAESRIELLMREGHPILTGGSPADFAVASGSFLKDALAEFDFLTLGVRHPSIEVDDYGALLELVRHTDLVALTSSLFAQPTAMVGLARVPLRMVKRSSANYALIRSADRVLSPAGRRAAGIVVNAIRRGASTVSAVGSALESVGSPSND